MSEKIRIFNFAFVENMLYLHNILYYDQWEKTCSFIQIQALVIRITDDTFLWVNASKCVKSSINIGSMSKNIYFMFVWVSEKYKTNAMIWVFYTSFVLLIYMYIFITN